MTFLIKRVRSLLKITQREERSREHISMLQLAGTCSETGTLDSGQFCCSSEFDISDDVLINDVKWPDSLVLNARRSARTN